MTYLVATFLSHSLAANVAHEGFLKRTKKSVKFVPQAKGSHIDSLRQYATTYDIEDWLLGDRTCRIWCICASRLRCVLLCVRRRHFSS